MLKSIKKIIVLSLISALVVGGIVGCSSEEAGGGASDKINIGVSIANFDDTFLTYMMDGMRAFADTHSDIDIEFVDANEDMSRQMDQVENFIVQQKDAIIVVPVDTSATQPMTQMTTTEDIPLVYVNRTPDELPEGTYFVGSEDIVAGTLQMEFLAEALGGEGKIAVLMGRLDNEATISRTEGVESVVAEYPGLEIVDKQTGLWQRNEGMMVTEDWLNRFGDELTAIASNNDDMALGAIQALVDAGREDVIVVGVDATPDGLAALASGGISATVFQDADGQGSGAVETAYQAVKGEVVEQTVWIPFQLVTPENLHEFQ